MAESTTDYLFPGPKGKPMHDIRTSFENACTAARNSLGRSRRTLSDTPSHPASP